jgi:EamA domain-containing membrane protein RarD
MKYFDVYISGIFIIKIGFILLAIAHIYLKMKGKNKSKQDEKILYWKDRFEFLFVLLMAFLLIFLFNPRKQMAIIDSETKLLLFMFGIVLLITAKWTDFIYETKWIKIIQSSIRN